nr:hypothetical protein Iba_chr02dCG5320 [Ipomoea batatas]
MRKKTISNTFVLHCRANTAARRQGREQPSFGYRRRHCRHAHPVVRSSATATPPHVLHCQRRHSSSGADVYRPPSPVTAKRHCTAADCFVVIADLTPPPPFSHSDDALPPPMLPPLSTVASTQGESSRRVPLDSEKHQG